MLLAMQDKTKEGCKAAITQEEGSADLRRHRRAEISESEENSQQIPVCTFSAWQKALLKFFRTQAHIYGVKLSNPLNETVTIRLACWHACARKRVSRLTWHLASFRSVVSWSADLGGDEALPSKAHASRQVCHVDGLVFTQWEPQSRSPGLGGY